jgi:4-hydroxy-3-polyprenylbenzoate decarboxylase
MSEPALPIVVAITGASGVAYGVRLLEVLLAAGRDVHLAISSSGQIVLKQELDLTVDVERFNIADLKFQQPLPAKLTYHHYKDLMAPIASGSFLTAGMVICPCSGSTLGAVVHSVGENLIHRAADVHLKERRKLILVPRETPLSLVQIDNMRHAAEAGAVVLPAMPGFYHGAKTIEDLVDFVVARICDQLGIQNNLMQRWGCGDSAAN